MMRIQWAAVCALLAACDAGSGSSKDDNHSDTSDSSLSPSVGAGVSQDFGQFRGILESGALPGPETIDDVGFFNEHVVSMPEPDCGEDVCLHGLVGSMGNLISGSPCTVVTLGMNSPVDPAELERPPLNLAFVIDTSGSMSGDPIRYVRSGLTAALSELEPEDRISLVTFGSDAQVLADGLAGDDTRLLTAIDEISARGSTNLYEGLRRGFEALDRHTGEGYQDRVILLSDGESTAGLTDPTRALNLSEAWANYGYSLTTIGVGDSFEPELMRGLAEVGDGAFYFLEDPAAVEEVFIEELSFFLFPIAEDARITLELDDGWEAVGVYGTNQAEWSGQEVVLDIPLLQLAHRTSASDNDSGRRGGGGAIIVEVMATGAIESGVVGQAGLDYHTPVEGALVSQALSTEVAGELPWFFNTAAEKSFVMLNLYVGFKLAAERAAVHNYTAAMSVLVPLRAGVASWLEDNADSDIEDDLYYLDLFIRNLEAFGGGARVAEGEISWPQD